ncbi:hypothetical protein [Paenibacillus sp. UMB4589-SE434]|uniref:hypothetical protein n=1 Tax=Paenibacillus sp. UMB4589-SE434 TaxID=3046314 RepID=UPI00254E46A1|nr:hypothetical protein [Paenibacillus sp. UMB4589-SE434]MDK8183879.1 hypothetical protein [Paenibacillus sp. UMB4589-SE434]
MSEKFNFLLMPFCFGVALYGLYALRREDAQLLLPPFVSGIDLDLAKPAYSSGNEVDYLGPEFAVDGKWGQEYRIPHVILRFKFIYSIMIATVWDGKQGKEGTDAYYTCC